MTVTTCTAAPERRHRGGGQRGDQRLAFAGLHLGQAAAQQHARAGELHRMRPHAEAAPARLADAGEDRARRGSRCSRAATPCSARMLAAEAHRRRAASSLRAQRSARPFTAGVERGDRARALAPGRQPAGQAAQEVLDADAAARRRARRAALSARRKAIAGERRGRGSASDIEPGQEELAQAQVTTATPAARTQVEAD